MDIAKYIIAVFVILLFLLPCFAEDLDINLPQVASVLEASVSASNEYLIGPGDTLQVFDYITENGQTRPTLIQETIVLPDGTVNIVPVGIMNINGLTLKEVNTLVNKESLKYIKNPSLYISISKLKPINVYVTGAVVRPGSYSNKLPSTVYGAPTRVGNLTESPVLTLMTALEMAGGLENKANIRSIIIHRPMTNQTFTVDLWKMFYEEDFSQDTYLQSGDIVKVPTVQADEELSVETFKSISNATVYPALINVKILGEVHNPGFYQLPTDADLVMALAKAGGTTKFTSNNIFIARLQPDGTIKRIDIKISDAVRNADTLQQRVKVYSNDLIYVNGSNAKRVGNFILETAQGLARSFSAAVLFNVIK